MAVRPVLVILKARDQPYVALASAAKVEAFFGIRTVLTRGEYIIVQAVFAKL